MTREEAKSCIGTIEMLQRLAYNIHGVMDVIDADNCKKIIKALEQESILDKIREQIMSNLKGVDIALEVLAENHPLRQKMEGAKDTLVDCLDLIDKAETEAEDGECK